MSDLEALLKTSVSVMYLAHVATLVAGAYKGIMDATGHESNTALPYYVMGGNVVVTGASMTAVSLFSPKSAEQNPYQFPLNTAVKQGIGCAGIAIVASPIEFTVGYALGYVGGKVFS